MKKVEADAKKRIEAEKKKKEEAKKPTQQVPSDPGYVDPGTGYNPPSSGGNTYTPAPTLPPVTYSCPYMSVGAAEAAGQAATSGNYAVQNCGDGSYNYKQHNYDGEDNWGSSDF